jgi:hypothetical protein
MASYTTNVTAIGNLDRYHETYGAESNLSLFSFL